MGREVSRWGGPEEREVLRRGRSRGGEVLRRGRSRGGEVPRRGRSRGGGLNELNSEPSHELKKQGFELNVNMGPLGISIGCSICSPQYVQLVKNGDLGLVNVNSEGH